MTTEIKANPVKPITSDPLYPYHRLLLLSEKFVNWKPESEPDKKLKIEDLTQSKASAKEKHYTPDVLAELWGVSAETIRGIFRNEPDVLRYTQSDGSKRSYVLIRIPESVAERVHKRLSAIPR